MPGRRTERTEHTYISVTRARARTWIYSWWVRSVRRRAPGLRAKWANVGAVVARPGMAGTLAPWTKSAEGTFCRGERLVSGPFRECAVRHVFWRPGRPRTPQTRPVGRGETLARPAGIHASRRHLSADQRYAIVVVASRKYAEVRQQLERAGASVARRADADPAVVLDWPATTTQ